VWRIGRREGGREGSEVAEKIVKMRLGGCASFESKERLAAMWLLLLPMAMATPVASKTTTGPDDTQCG
jgi:hypothetical protein